MSKSKILVSLLLITLFVSSVCFATDDVETQEISLDQLLGETATSDQLVTTADDSQTSNWKNSDLYVIDEKVTISDVVDGNAFVMAKEVTVTGEIGGDLFVMAETVNIEGGYIYSSIFAMANEINIDGITYDLYAACSKLNLKENGLVYRDMRVAAGEVNLSGRVRRDAYITAGNLNISENAGIIALSALMTTTMQEMKNVVRLAKEKNCNAKIIIGGAVVTEDYAWEIGADGYSSDAANCVRVVKKIISEV